LLGLPTVMNRCNLRSLRPSLFSLNYRRCFSILTSRLLNTAPITLLLIANAPALHAATITGEVKFIGERPKLVPVKVSKDQDYCGETLPNESYSIDSTNGFGNVVVYVESAPSVAADPKKLNVIENNGCRYSPRISGMQKGERLLIKNNDPKLHIPHSYLHDKTVFMLSLPFKNTALEATHKIREAGVLKLVCDTHAWMLGFMHVFDHPYFAVTDDQGRFTIPNLPSGSYTLKAWHEEAGSVGQQITVADGDGVHVLFELNKS
jgi:Carboxypeptidase regulatory-like domain